MINPGSNGGSDYGIFWNVGTGITIGANNALLGNYLSGTSATLGAQSSVSGRVMALAAITLDQNAIDVDGNGWTGGLGYDHNNAVIAIPEPTTDATFLGLAILGVVFVGRRHFQPKPPTTRPHADPVEQRQSER